MIRILITTAAVVSAISGGAIIFNIIRADSEISPTADQIAAPKSIFSDAISAYFDGDFNNAVTKLTGIATSSADFTQRMEARLLLANICDEIDHRECTADNNSELMTLLEQAGDANTKKSYFLAIAPSLLSQHVWAGQLASYDPPKLVNNLNHEDFFAFRPDKYLMLQTAEAQLAMQREDLDEVQRTTSRLIAAAVALPANYEYLLAPYLVEIIATLDAGGDARRALIYKNKFDEFILAHLPEKSAVRVKYLRLCAQLNADLGTRQAYREALEQIDRADEILGKLQGPEQLKTAAIASLAMLRTELLILSGDAGKAAEIHARNPLQAMRSTIQQAEEFSAPEMLQFALIDTYISYLQKKPADAGWKTLFQAKSRWEQGGLGSRFEAERKLGLSLVSWSDNPSLAKSTLEEAAREQIALFERSLYSLGRAFPLPSFGDRILLGLELDSLSEKSSLSRAERSIAIKAVSILQRNILHSRGDILYLSSAFKSEKDKGYAHSWLLLSDRRAELELRGLTQRTEAFGQVAASAADAQNHAQKFIQTRSTLMGLTRQIDQMLAPLQLLTARLHELPDAEQVSMLLTPGEAILAQASLADNQTAYKVCIGSGNSFGLAKTAIEPRLIVDGKILSAALTASYAPSDELDSQYPAQSALRLKQFVMDGLEPCLAGKTRLFYNPVSELSGIPLAALLEKLPPKAGEGYDLTKADWLVRKYDIANISSLPEFVAARELSINAGGEFSFLGIGDPVLTQEIADGKTSGQILASRGTETVAGSLASLAELPETGIELRKIAALYPAPRLLLRSEASKSRFLAEPLGHFNTIEFATHGLLTGELAGITEPGLVLSPLSNSGGSAGDDGFLSSTEISALRLQARLVVLSACNTAKFEVDKFAGNIRGLTTSFAMAGVPTVIASLWPVESTTSQRLMTGFFEQSLGNQKPTISTALARSVRTFLDTAPSRAYLHPRFWAPFSVFGDGGAYDTDRPAVAGRFTIFEAGTESGEIVGMTRPKGSAASYVARMGGWNGQRFSSFIEQRSRSGAVGWQVRDDAIAAGKIISAKDRLFVEGFISEAGSRNTTPILRAFDLAGNLLWKRMLSDGKSPAFVADLAISAAGNLWAVIRSNDYTGAEETVHVLEINQDGRVMKDRTIAVKNEEGGFQTTLVVPHVDGGAYLFSTVPSRPARVFADDFGERHICFSGGGTEIIKLGDDQSTPVSLGVQRGVHINQAKLIGSEIYVAGTKLNDCDSEGEPFFGNFSSGKRNSSLHVLYVEKGFFGGKFKDFVGNENKIVLSGQIQNQIKEWTPTDATAFDPRTGLMTPGFDRTDSFLVEIDPRRSQQDSKIRFLDAGSDLAISGMEAEENGLTLAGNIGAYPLWAQYSMH